ncbi:MULTISPECIES: hypothetical protein [unclassified Luteococcus]|uniref:hypothetical protein n=1 Tax=unclassified Luteococcus TaxID=2639923 RepID=UPI00313CFE17
MRGFSNLNLNGNAPARVQPKVGEWGPERVPTTQAKKRLRIWVSLAFIGAVAALCGLGWYFYKAMNGLS